jgi:hypothetical protein
MHVDLNPSTTNPFFFVNPLSGVQKNKEKKKEKKETARRGMRTGHTPLFPLPPPRWFFLLLLCFDEMYPPAHVSTTILSTNPLRIKRMTARGLQKTILSHLSMPSFRILYLSGPENAQGLG